MSDTSKTLRTELDAAQRTIAELQMQIEKQGKQHKEPTVPQVDLDTALKQIEQAHQEWMSALDAIDDPVFVHDKEFCILRANRAYQQRVGIPFKEFIGRPYFKFFPKAAGPMPGCRHGQEAFEDGEEEEVITEGRTYRSRAYPVHDRQGEYLYSVHAMEDVTDRKTVDAKLRESEAFTKTILDNLPVGIAVNSISPSVSFSYMNDNFPLIYRVSREKLADPDTFWEAVYENSEYRKLIRKQVLDDCASGDVSRMHWDDITLARMGEITAYISARNVPLPDQHLMISMVWDVTERKIMENQLREHWELLRAFIANSPIYTFIKEVSPTESKVLAASDNYADMIGMQGKEMTGKTMPELFPADFAEKITADDWRAVSSNKVLHLDEELNDRRYLTIKFPIPMGDRTYLAGYTIDVTERKQHEAAILRANRALRTISAGNQTLIHASDEGSLLQEMCEVAVEFGGYHMAWIGYARDDADKSIEQMAQAGFEQGCPSLSQLSWHEGGPKACPAGDAIIQRKTRVVQDIQADSGVDPWRAHAQQYGYASCIALPLLDGDKAFGTLVLFDDKVDVFDAAEVSLLEELAGDLAFGILTLRIKADHREHEQRLQRNMLKTVEAIASIVEMRDPYTSGHQRRVAELAGAIAQKMGMSEEEGLAIRLAGIVHDLGKIKIPAEILSKPGRLNDMEYNFIKMHPQAGYEILKEIDFSWPIADMVHQHHERMDGSGYPLGIKGDEFLPGSRILAVADVMEAMSSHRPYRPGLGIAAGLEELQNGRGTLFDPHVVDACTTLFKEDGYELPQ